jgi:phosphoribosylformylglycinamidine cyclo-ligase
MDTISNVAEGQVLIAIPSSGIHSNGYSLVRKIFFEKLGMSLNDDFNGKPLVDTLLEPTRIYIKLFKEHKSRIKALAHITGGGIVENLPRVLPEGIKAIVNKSTIRTLPIFDFMSQYVSEEEMYRTFNMGVGMVWVVDAVDAEAILSSTDGYIIGALASGNKEVELI